LENLQVRDLNPVVSLDTALAVPKNLRLVYPVVSPSGSVASASRLLPLPFAVSAAICGHLRFHDPRNLKMMSSLKPTIAALALLAACAAEPIEWEPPRDMAGTIGATTRLIMDSSGAPRLVDGPAVAVALPPGACERSLVSAQAQGEERYAAWFLARPDSSVALVVARSSDGGATWSTSVVADGRDRGRRGCARPAPALAADSANAYVHAAYFIEPADGAGVWYTHSMERGALWHQTIGVLYGEEPAAASIASAGDTVLVAYEHPGSGGSRLGVAISRQAGHTFDERLRAVQANGTLSQPRIALRGGRVAMAWREQGPTPRADAPEARTRIRIGRWR